MTTCKAKLVVWGAGGHGLVVADIVRCAGRFEVAGFVDDGPGGHDDQRPTDLPVFGGREQLDRLRGMGIEHLLVAVGDCQLRLRLAEVAIRQGFTLVTAVHPQAVVAASATLEPGTVVAAGAVINPGARVGRNVIVNTCASVDHECELGDGVHVCPGVRLGGNVRVGRATQLGIGAAVAHGVHIGANAMIGAGAAVLSDIPDDVVAYGVPARVIKPRPLVLPLSGASQTRSGTSEATAVAFQGSRRSPFAAADGTRRVPATAFATLIDALVPAPIRGSLPIGSETCNGPTAPSSRGSNNSCSLADEAKRPRPVRSPPLCLSLSARASQPPLAIEGGPPVRTGPMPAWPVFDADDTAAVANVLRSGKVNYWTGTEGRRFEEEFAAQAGCRYGVALSNGTLALELALAASGIGPGDDVVVTCRSFIASASCCVARGAVPVFADVDFQSQNITAETVRAALTPRTKAIVAVHLAGWPCEMDAIMELAGQHGLQVIEDCAQAHGATYRGRPVGSLGHVAAFSFCQDKIMTTGGEGGMITTNDAEVWERAWSLKDHGKNRAAAYRQESPGVFRWLHDSFGTNGRMTEMQAALGRAMLGKLPGWVAARRQNAALLGERLASLPALRIARPPEHCGHSYYKFFAFLRPERLRNGWNRDGVVAALLAEGIPCGSGICPEIYREKAFDGHPSCPAAPLPNARQLGQTSLMFVVHPTLAENDLDDTCRAVEKVLRAASSPPVSLVRRAA